MKTLLGLVTLGLAFAFSAPADAREVVVYAQKPGDTHAHRLPGSSPHFFRIQAPNPWDMNSRVAIAVGHPDPYSDRAAVHIKFIRLSRGGMKVVKSVQMMLPWERVRLAVQNGELLDLFWRHSDTGFALPEHFLIHHDRGQVKVSVDAQGDITETR